MLKQPATAIAIQNQLAAELDAFDRAARRLGPESAAAHDLSWWCEAATALSVAADRGGTLDLDLRGGRYGHPERSMHSARNARRTAAWLTGLAAGRAKGRIVEPDTLLEIHHSTLLNVLDPSRVGSFRKRDVRIIDHRTGTEVARGTPPADLERELELWSRAFKPPGNASAIHPLIRSGLAHLELARIHPFSDGNGRTARILIAGMHAEDGLPKLPFPLEFERNRATYLGEVTDALQAADPVRYLRWHVGAMRESVETALALGAKTKDLAHRMTRAMTCDGVPEKAAWAITRSLITQPITTASDIAERAKVDERTVREGLWQLEQKQLNTRHARLGDVSFFICFDSLSEAHLEFARPHDRAAEVAPFVLAQGASEPAALTRAAPRPDGPGPRPER